jgi:hypothetical protein
MGDVPSQHLMRPSHPLAGSVKVIQQAARLLGLLANSAPVPSGAPYSSSLLQASPARQGYGDLGCQGTRRSSRQQALVGPKHYIPYVPRPTCRGPVPLCMPPFSYKRGGIRRYKTGSLRPNFRQTLTSSYKLPSNTSHSGVGYYAMAARTTLNPRVFPCVDPPVS